MKVPKVVETRHALSLRMPKVKDFNQLYCFRLAIVIFLLLKVLCLALYNEMKVYKLFYKSVIVWNQI